MSTMFKLNPLSKLIFLSILIAIGFLNIILSCALFDNWLPLIDVGIFLIAPLPNALAQSLSSAYEADFLSDSNPEAAVKEFLEYLTGFLVISGLIFPVVLFHNHLISHWSLVLSISGGFIIYLSIVLFIVGFKEEADDYDF
ncbi:hypothetical protein OGAPHI_004697 [Ogataea philodendri]|uniref:Vacuolar protein sorting-associated protein 55 n=1 Tax=Ogataea philodendri TaxID=1378263 RepID=A0A9P8P1A9_9ASCO|nr:uncharacterized protein OGAPHI_004697 [Ogataea philodendri]KAH3663983.1 hypothetical protein OGAPHI_004697 [Ogataea philodendri]